MNIILGNKNLIKDKFLLAISFLIFFIPISLIIGNAATNINIILISLLIFFKFLKNKEWQSLITKKNLIILFFFIGIIVKDFFLLLQLNTKSIYLIKFFFLYIAVDYFFSKYHKLIPFFSYLLLFILLFFSADVAYQYFFGKDFFNISSDSIHRFSGFMGTEWLAGSYISKFALLSLFPLILNKKYIYLIILLLAIFFLIILFSGERMALINYFLLVIIFIGLFTYKKYFSLKDIFFLITILLLTFIIFFQSLDEKRKRIYTIDVLLKLKIADKIANIYDLSDRDQKTIKNESIKNNTHFDIFLSSYKIYKHNILFGTGTDKFYQACENFKGENLYCESHSHNTYLNIISEQGTIIFLLFIYLIYNNLFKTYKYNKNNQNYLISLIVIIVFLNPLSISGDIFSTWTGTTFWYIFGICSGLSKKQSVYEK